MRSDREASKVMKLRMKQRFCRRSEAWVGKEGKNNLFSFSKSFLFLFSLFPLSLFLLSLSLSFLSLFSLFSISLLSLFSLFLLSLSLSPISFFSLFSLFLFVFRSLFSLFPPKPMGKIKTEKILSMSISRLTDLIEYETLRRQL